jgi:hypothetical protein
MKYVKLAALTMACVVMYGVVLPHAVIVHATTDCHGDYDGASWLDSDNNVATYHNGTFDFQLEDYDESYCRNGIAYGDAYEAAYQSCYDVMGQNPTGNYNVAIYHMVWNSYWGGVYAGADQWGDCGSLNPA